jgi:glycosyltransferase involved in cell wall biosynthesis
MKIVSPVTTGSGVEVVHRCLSESIPGYKLKSVNPRKALFAPLLRPMSGEWDIVHTIPDLGNFGDVPRIRSVVTFHGFSFDSFSLRHASLIQRLFYRGLLESYVKRAMRRSDVVTAVSKFTAGLVQEYFGVMPRVIENGVDCQRFAPSNKGRENAKLRVLFSGNPSRHKGWSILERLAVELEDTCEFICASGLRANEGEQVTGAVRCLGRVNYQDMPSLYQSADLLLLPTLREGMSLSTLEAMACGLPVLTTNLASQPELIDHGLGGYTLDYNDLSGFARCLRALAGEPTLRYDMGEHNRHKVLEKYTLKRMVTSYRQVFESIAS